MGGSGTSWAILKSAPRSRQITTPAPCHSVFYKLDALPAAQPTHLSSEGKSAEPTSSESITGELGELHLSRLIGRPHRANLVDPLILRVVVHDQLFHKAVKRVDVIAVWHSRCCHTATQSGSSNSLNKQIASASADTWHNARSLTKPRGPIYKISYDL